jgi:hypothetical protein
MQYSISRGGLRLVREVARAGVDAQLGLQRLAHGAGPDEADQVLSEDRRLRPGGQADGQPPSGDVIDGAAPRVGRRDAVADQPLVELQIRELALLNARSRVHLGWDCGPGPGHRTVAAVRLSRWALGGWYRARPGGGAGLRSGLGGVHRVAALGGDAEELL